MTQEIRSKVEATSLVDLAHGILWRAGLGFGNKPRTLRALPVEVLEGQMRCPREQAQSLVDELTTRSILRKLGDRFQVIAGTFVDNVGDESPEFVALREYYLRGGIEDRRAVDEFVGISRSTEEVRGRIELASEFDDIAIITGESGVGKGLAAELVHRLSHRRDEKFVHINCAALNEGVLESELFGHEKGAFTSAIAKHEGCFERAGRGTVFLDEIGEVSLGFQGKLLQVLENGKFVRVGGDREITSQARIIVATNKNLVNAVMRKAFRLDLFFRLYTVPIAIPPLRERREDLPHLVAHYAALLARSGNPYRLSPASYEKIVSDPHEWAGNARELQTVMRMSQRLARGSLVEPQHIEFLPLKGLREE